MILISCALTNTSAQCVQQTINMPNSVIVDSFSSLFVVGKVLVSKVYFHCWTHPICDEYIAIEIEDKIK